MTMQIYHVPFIDHPFDPKFHLPGRNGRNGLCTIGGCKEAPVVSRHWHHYSSSLGWWAAYCLVHKEQSEKWQ